MDPILWSIDPRVLTTISSAVWFALIAVCMRPIRAFIDIIDSFKEFKVVAAMSSPS
jgi:hypothetical protein